jgi:hypothetical protein
VGRRLRANSGKERRPKAGPVAVYMRRGRAGWTLPQAAHMLAQGYTPQHVESATGYDYRVVANYIEKEGVPTWEA